VHFEPHAAIGWAIGNIAKADRRLRNYCLLGAILPDIDAITILFGSSAYAHYHHTFGHNVFTWALFTGIATLHCRSWKALVVSFLSFGTHLLADAKLSAWELYFFWPFSIKGYVLPHSIGLESPINTHLVYYSFVVVALLALIYRRTPIDIFAPRLDQLLMSAFKKKNFRCHVCGTGANQTCDACGEPVCTRHITVQRNLSVICPECVRAKAIAASPSVPARK
jgi:hypothetical protein